MAIVVVLLSLALYMYKPLILSRSLLRCVDFSRFHNKTLQRLLLCNTKLGIFDLFASGGQDSHTNNAVL